MVFSSKFYGVQREFVGDGSRVIFFNAEDFRVYLNAFFNVGDTTSSENSGFVHWVFTSDDGTVCDSIADGHQPVRDTHCTIFSLFYEVREYRGGFLTPMSDLETLANSEVQGSREHCVNLIALYTMLEVLFRYSPFTDYVEDFKPWRSRRRGWTSKYASMASSNRTYLENYISRFDDSSSSSADTFIVGSDDTDISSDDSDDDY